MPSYQDLETRIRTLEDVVGWFMTTFGIQRIQGGPLAITPKVERFTYLDLYREAQQNALKVAAEATKNRRAGKLTVIQNSSNPKGTGEVDNPSGIDSPGAAPPAESN